MFVAVVFEYLNWLLGSSSIENEKDGIEILLHWITLDNIEMFQLIACPPFIQHSNLFLDGEISAPKTWSLSHHKPSSNTRCILNISNFSSLDQTSKRHANFLPGFKHFHLSNFFWSWLNYAQKAFATSRTN